MSYSKARDLRLVDSTDENGPLPCLWCQKQTPRTILNQYGARCVSCYERYCAEPQPMPRWMADKRTDGDKAWAYALKTRHEAGEKLTGAQIAMYRVVTQRVGIEVAE